MSLNCIHHIESRRPTTERFFVCIVGVDEKSSVNGPKSSRIEYFGHRGFYGVELNGRGEIVVKSIPTAIEFPPMLQNQRNITRNIT